MTEEKKIVNYKEIAKQEYTKCLSNPEYFIQKYVYIQMTNGGRGKFILYTFQKKLLHLMLTRDRLIVLKSRQLGITTLSAAYSLWLMVFKKDQSILALAPDQDKARSILDKISFAYDELPTWLLTLANAHSTENNKLRITLNNGSKAQAASGSPKASRGKTATFLVLDEAAFIDTEPEATWAAAQQTLSTGGSAILLSTPNGTDNLFHRLYTDAEMGENEFIAIPLKWNVHPDRDQAWRDRQEKELGKRMANQECDASFLESGDTYLDTELLVWIKAHTEVPVEERPVLGPTKDFWVWKFPWEVNNCAVILDTSRGDGLDAAGIQVIDLFSAEQVAEYRGSATPKELAKLGVQVALDYNSALLIIENTGIGESTCSYAKDSGYQNIFYSPKGDTMDMHEYLNKYFDKNKEDMTCGFTNSSKTRPVILGAMQQAFLDKTFRVRSIRTANELSSFIWKNGKAQAANGRHDDLVIPLAIGIFLRDTAINYQTQGMDMQRAVLGGIKKTTSLDVATYNLNNQNSFNSNPYMVQNPYSGVMEDVSWALTGKW